MHKLRRAMVRPGREQLSGRVEIDESFVGGRGGAQGRSTATKALIVVAAEEAVRGIGRIRMRRIPDASADSLQAFIADAITPGSVVHMDGWHGYDHVAQNGYRHEITLLRGDHELASARLPRVHRVVSLLKRWLLGTHQGAISQPHLDSYLDEFTFRFNRRTSRHRGKLFFTWSSKPSRWNPSPIDDWSSTSAAVDDTPTSPRGYLSQMDSQNSRYFRLSRLARAAPRPSRCDARRAPRAARVRLCSSPNLTTNCLKS